MADIIDRLKEACNGHPAAKIPWPHRLLHDAIAEIDRLRTWSHIDKELSAYVQAVRAETIEECARIAEEYPATHAEFCIAEPGAVRRNAAERIRAKIASLMGTIGPHPHSQITEPPSPPHNW